MTARQPQTRFEAAMLGLTGLGYPAVTAGPQPAGVQRGAPLAPNRPRGLFGASVRSRPFQVGMGSADFAGDAGAPSVDMAGAPPPIDAAPPPPSNWKNVVGPELMAQIPPIDPYASQGIGAGSGINGEPAMTLPPSPPMRGGMFGNPSSPPAMTGMQGMSAPPSGKIGNGGVLFGGAREKEREKARDKPGFLARGGAGVDILGGLADGLAQYFGGQPQYVPAMYKRQQDERNHNQRLAQMQEETRLKLSEPDYATINNRRVRIDPTTGKSEVLYTAPQDFDDYAASLGAEPGTDEYDRLVQDYVLRGSGPTATDNYNVREDWRQENREELEGIRQNNRIGLQSHRQAGQRALKGVPTYRQANPAPPRSGGRTGASGSIPEGATATGPGGAKMIRRGGKWVDLK